MRRRLLAAASMIVMAGASAFADEEINNERTSPVRTSTSGDIVITSSGRVTLTGNPGPAVVVDSDNTLETRSGSNIGIAGQDGSVGILIEGGRDTGLVHGGVISISASETNSNAPLDEAYDSITDERDKTGIQIGTDGDSAVIGDVLLASSSSVVVTGQSSYGVRVVSGLDGNLTANGAISVVGENSTALAINDALSGDITIGGGAQIAGRGTNTHAINVSGDVGGMLQVGGAISTNGFRISERVTQSIFELLSARGPGETLEDSRLGGSAIVIAGSIQGGVFFAGQGSGLLNQSAAISSTGSSPTVLIRPRDDASGDLTLGTVSYDVIDTSEDAEDGDTVLRERNFGFVNDGSITSNGIFDGVSSNALLIAGRDVNGTIHAVILGGRGLENTSVISASSYDAHAEAVHIGEAVRGQSLTNTRGALVIATASAGFADDGFADSSFGTGSAVAVRLAEGAEIAELINDGAIRARVVGRGHSASAIIVQSEQLSLISNSGIIEAAGLQLVDGEAPQLVAIDARGHASGLSIRQIQNPTENAEAPRIIGDILLGDGDDVIELLAGSINGNISFGAGMDQFVVRGANFTGDIDSGDGQLVLDVEDGSLAIGLRDRIDITSARFGDGGTLNLVLGANSGSTDTLVASGAIDFEAGSELVVSLSELIGAGRTFQVLSAGTLNIAEDDVILDAVDTPFLYNASLERDPDNANALVLSLTRKTAAEAGLDANRAVVYDAAISLFEDVTSLGNAIASIRDADSFYRAYDQLLPEYAASAIQFALAAHDAAAGALSTRLRNARLSPDELAGIWIQEFGYFADRAETTFGPGYRGQGVGLAVGLDRPWGPFYAVGVTLAGAASDIEQVGLPHEPMTALMGQFSAYAAADLGALDVSLTASAGINRFETNRFIQIGNFGGNTTASWSGWHYSAALQAGRDISLGDWILRPELALTYLSITEDGFNEVAQGNTPAELALYVDSRTTSALTGGATFTVGRMYRRAGSWWLPYARVGYRGDFSGNGAETTARFGQNGSPFTLRASEMPGAGILAGLGLSAGSEYTTFTFAYDADMREDYIAHVLRLVLRMNF